MERKFFVGYRDDFFADNTSNYGWYTCIRCKRKFRKGDIDIDHILPQHYGGGDGLDNLQCLCKHCNRSKQDDLSDVPSDYLRHNVNRTIKKISDWFR